MCSKVLNGHIILTDTSITTILAPEMTYTPKMTKRELRLRALKDGVVSVYSGVAIPAAVKDGVTAGRLRSAAQGESFL